MKWFKYLFLAPHSTRQGKISGNILLKQLQLKLVATSQKFSWTECINKKDEKKKMYDIILHFVYKNVYRFWIGS